MTQHKSGFVNIIGNPNVGKSTLMNAMVGEKMSIITSKAQTTRHRIIGIVNGDDFQIVYSDTPGIINPKYKLQESMMQYVGSAIADADVILYMTDTFETSDKNLTYIDKIKDISIPVLVLINKIDLSNEEKVTELVEAWNKLLPKAKVIPISALNKFNTDTVFKIILENLPLTPPYYPKDQLTDRSERFFVSEIIREKILLTYKKEIPYSVEVNVEEFIELEDIIRIRAIIYAERESQKGILIGHKGSSLKKVGTEARLDIEAFFEKKVFLQLHIKINKNWKSKPNELKRFGYFQ